MQFVISFLEGIITFISPCLLPMLPIYVSYFAGGETEGKKSRALRNALGFVLGFTLLFVLLGALSATLGGFVRKYSTAVNIVTGLIVVVFGLNFLGVIKIGFLNATKRHEGQVRELGFFSSVLFGIIFSVGWTPCVGAFLGSALLLSSQQGDMVSGIIMLLCYSLGLGIPFIVSAVLIEKLKTTFDFIKRHYKAINIVSGSMLIVVGVLMMTGLMGYFLSILTF